jgi:regulator of RNase E activity RraA
VTKPQALAYREGMTVLDAVLAVGGLGQFAAGNRAHVVRMVDGKQTEIRVKLGALVNDGDMKQNIALKPGDVLVASTNHSRRTCFWGELLSTAAIARGATGCAIDGHTRDALRIMEMEFPVFTTGFRPVDSSSRSKVIDFGCPVEVGGVVVNAGDIIFGDFDGIVVIPPDRLEPVVTAAHKKVTSENASRDMLREGAMLRDVYDRFGVL